MRAIVLLLAIAGCAQPKPPPAAPATAKVTDAGLEERAAGLFDAATHDDRLRLKALIDWPRYRTFNAWRTSADDASAARALAQLEAEPQPSAQFLDGAVAQLAQVLRAVAAGPLPPRPRHDAGDARLEALRAGVAAGTAPSLARLATQAGEALQGGGEISYEGTGRITFVFVSGQLAAMLDGK
jgi:hypothetical protein